MTTSDYYIPEYGRIVASRPPPGGAPADLVARMKYAESSWWERLTTCPPPGWRGGWTAQLVSRWLRGMGGSGE